MTRYTPGQCENPQKEIDRLHAEVRRLRQERKQALTELAVAVKSDITLADQIDRAKSDLDSAARRVLDAGLTIDHANNFDDLMGEVLSEFAKMKADRDELKKLVDEIIRHNGWDFELPGEA